MKHIVKEVNYKLLVVTSIAFKEDELIPGKYTCDGKNINPPLNIEHIPVETKCLAVIVDDPDAPVRPWVHWVMWDIPVTHHIKEDGAHGVQGTNDFGKQVYSGPCPPVDVMHRYYFKVYAVDCTLGLYITSEKHDVEKAMAGHILAFGELVGLYKR